MEWPAITTTVAALVAVSVLVGAVLRRREGRVSRPGSRLRIAPHELTDDEGNAPRFGTTATLVQFSTMFCARCPATKRMLSELASATDGVAHVDVDLTNRKDLADRYAIVQTPTVLVLDADGVAHSRIGGAPVRAVVASEVDRIAGRGAR